MFEQFDFCVRAYSQAQDTQLSILTPKALTSDLQSTCEQSDGATKKEEDVSSPVSESAAEKVREFLGARITF